MSIRELSDGRFEVKMRLETERIRVFQVQTFYEAQRLDAMSRTNKKLYDGDLCTCDEIEDAIAVLENIGIVRGILYNRFKTELRKQQGLNLPLR